MVINLFCISGRSIREIDDMLCHYACSAAFDLRMKVLHLVESCTIQTPNRVHILSGNMYRTLAHATAMSHAVVYSTHQINDGQYYSIEYVFCQSLVSDVFRRSLVSDVFRRSLVSDIC